MKPTLIVIGIAALALLAFPLVIGTQSGRQPTAAEQTIAHQPPSPSRTGTVTIDRGIRQSAYGSTWQAQELVAAIALNPSASRYVLTAKDTNGDSVEVTADLQAEKLTRTHHGNSSEVWDGYVMDRLKSAAEGGSLNDTPVGKRFGKYTAR
jgi:hypothetical protein